MAAVGVVAAYLFSTFCNVLQQYLVVCTSISSGPRSWLTFSLWFCLPNESVAINTYPVFEKMVEISSWKLGL